MRHLTNVSSLQGRRLRRRTRASFRQLILFEATLSQIWTLSEKPIIPYQLLKTKHSKSSIRCTSFNSFYLFIGRQRLGFAERLKLVVDLVESEFLLQLVVLLARLRQFCSLALELKTSPIELNERIS